MPPRKVNEPRSVRTQTRVLLIVRVLYIFVAADLLLDCASHKDRHHSLSEAERILMESASHPMAFPGPVGETGTELSQ